MVSTSKVIEESLVRKKQVRARTGLANSTISLFVSQGRFPAPVKIGKRAVAWTSSSIDNWIQEKVAASSVMPEQAQFKVAKPSTTNTASPSSPRLPTSITKSDHRCEAKAISSTKIGGNRHGN